MFHKISNVMAIPNYKIMVMFENEVVKEYDLKPLFEQCKQFCKVTYSHHLKKWGLLAR